MTPRGLVIVGVLVACLGAFYALQCWSMPMLYTPICNDHYHDRAVCISIRVRMFWSLLAPLPGVALVVLGRRRARR